MEFDLCPAWEHENFLRENLWGTVSEAREQERDSLIDLMAVVPVMRNTDIVLPPLQVGGVLPTVSSDEERASLEIEQMFGTQNAEEHLMQLPEMEATAKAMTLAIRQAPDIAAGLGKSQSKRDLLKLEEFLTRKLRMMVYQGQLCLYNGMRWRVLSKRGAATEFRRTFREYKGTEGLVVKDYRDLYDLLLINPDLEYAEELETPEYCVNLMDGVLNLYTGEFRPHRPEDGFFSMVNVEYSEIQVRNLEGPVFEAFVYNASDGDPIVRQQILELTALALTGCELKYFYVLLGPSHTGKTQLGRFIEELVGRDNVETIRGVSDFGDKWTIGTLVGKHLVTCLDLPDEPLPSGAVGTIKQLVGDDPLKAEKKFGDPFTFYKKPLLLMAGNHPLCIPNIEKEQALINRMVSIAFANPVPEGQMVQKIYKELLEESPYILKCAMEAFQNLAANNFCVAKGIVPKEFRPQEGNRNLESLQSFIAARCCSEQGHEVTTHELFTAYMTSSYANGLTEIHFARLLSGAMRNVPGVEALSRVAGIDQRGYRGIRILPTGQEWQ